MASRWEIGCCEYCTKPITVDCMHTHSLSSYARFCKPKKLMETVRISCFFLSQLPDISMGWSAADNSDPVFCSGGHAGK